MWNTFNMFKLRKDTLVALKVKLCAFDYLKKKIFKRKAQDVYPWWYPTQQQGKVISLFIYSWGYFTIGYTRLIVAAS